MMMKSNGGGREVARSGTYLMVLKHVIAYFDTES